MDIEEIKKKIKEHGYKVGELYKHYPYGKKYFIKNNSKIFSPGFLIEEGFPKISFKKLLCDDDGAPIVMFLGLRILDTHNARNFCCMILLNNNTIYCMPAKEIFEYDDLIEIEGTE